MPELPEVEVICRYLHTVLKGKEIDTFDVLLPRMLRNKDSKEARLLLEGNKIASVQRRGKYIQIFFEDKLLMLIHLRMTGRLVYHQSLDDNYDKHTRFIFTFTDETVLVFGDTRTFGSIDLFLPNEKNTLKGYISLGVEPLSKKFTGQLCYELCQRSQMPLKKFLLDQKYIAGIGNIYADEALFASSLSPMRSASSITQKEAKCLHKAIRKVLRLSLLRGGTTFRDYLNGEGNTGENQKYLYVYGRKNLPCVKCQHRLKGELLGGRQTVYCPNCQK